MTTTERPFGSLPDGRVATLFEIENTRGYRIALTDHGATLVSVRAPDRTGDVAEITVGFDELTRYLGPYPYYGATVGRVANRIGGASFSLSGTVYRLAANNAPAHLHGGTVGFNRHLWEAQPFSRPGVAGVLFHRLSPDGEEGYPGTLDVSVSISLTDTDELVFEYRAETDAPTPVNLTNHSYWNLASPPDARVAAGQSVDSLQSLRARPGGAIADHVLQLHADGYLAVDEAQIPTGEIIPVAGTPFDFRTPKAIGAEIAELEDGYDHCMVLSDPPVGGSGDDSLRPVAMVTDPHSKRRMEVFTTLPAVQFYSGNKLGVSKGRGGLAMAARDAFCLETQFYPDAVNHPEFPSIILNPGTTFEHRTVHRFGVE